MKALKLFVAATLMSAGWSGLAWGNGGLPDQLIVKYKDAPTASAANERVRLLRARTGIGMRWLRSTATGAQVLTLDRPALPGEIASILKELRADRTVAYAEEDLKVSIRQNDPGVSDPRFPDQWPLREPEGGINIAPAWTRTLGDGAVVAVIDTGRLAHADLGTNILNGYDFASFRGNNDGDGRDPDATDPGDANPNPADCPISDSSWHGMTMNGIIGALRNNRIGITGIAPNARIIAIRALGRCGGFISDLADSVIWAAGGQVGDIPVNTLKPNVINMSLGGTGACTATVQEAMNFALNRNITLVAAAGNSNSTTIDVPANCEGVISVGATGRTGARAPYSSFGPGITLMGPGGNQTTSTLFNGIISTQNTGTTQPAGDDYIFTQGTSTATAQVTAVVALMYAKNPTLTPIQVNTILRQTARPLTSPCGGCGAGILNAGGAVTAVPEPPPPVELTLTSSATNVQVGQSATLRWESRNAASCTASGDWSGAKPLSSQEGVSSNTTGTRNYTLTCANAVSSVSSTVSVAYQTPQRVRVSLTSDVQTQEAGKPAVLRWQSDNATSCSASGDWSGTKGVSGQESVTAATAGTRTYTLTCSNSSFSAKASVKVAFKEPPPPPVVCPTGFTGFNSALAAGRSEFKTSITGFPGRQGREIFGIFRSENRSAVMRVQIQRRGLLGLWSTVREHVAAGGPNADIIPPSDGQYRFNVKMESVGGNYTLCLRN